MKTLTLEKRGCNFRPGTALYDFSDVKNHRVATTEKLKSFDGREYFIEFSECTHYITRTTNKRTGAPLKHPVREVVQEFGLAVDTQYDIPANGYIQSFRNLSIERALWKKHLPFTCASILYAVEVITGEKYDNIQFI